MVHANLNLRNPFFSFLSRLIFDLGKKCLCSKSKFWEAEKMSYVGEFTQLRSFLNQDFTVPGFASEFG